MHAMHSSSFILILAHFFIIFSLILPSAAIPFSPSHNVTLYGDAYFKDYSITLTRELTCLSTSSSSGVGRALYAHPVRFLDPRRNSTASFFCRFTFSITPSRICPSADGFTFFITPRVDSFSTSKGYFGLPLDGQDTFVAIEFDTSYDSSLGDINENHIGVDVSSVVSFASVDAASRGINLKSGKRITAWIEYRDAVKLIKVWAGYSLNRPESPILVAQIDLSKQFSEFMFVGFSASNGVGSAVHTIERWQFKTFGLLPSSSPTDMVEERDCFLCSPEDFGYLSSSMVSQKRGIQIPDWVYPVGGSVVCLVSFLIVAYVIYSVIRRKVKSNERRSCKGQGCNSKVPKRLSLSLVKSATMGFNHNRVIGEGASATVYKGSLPSGGAVAIKRFNQAREFESIMRNPFVTEFATMVGCLRHKNLVQLQGWCCEGSELVLVYEYMPNGSLDRVLHKNSNSPTCLTWRRRKNIVLGVASALAYLHEECERQIIHRDVKSCNILLDESFNAKLGDFGLAEVYEHSCSTREATIPAGTMGYLAPEYVYSGVPTEKSDVYSFGVVVLEVATGRRPVGDYGLVLVDWVWSLWEKKQLFEVVDPRLMGNFNAVEMEVMLLVGLACVHPNHEKRPTVKEAAMMIKAEAPPPILPPRKPAMNIRSALPNYLDEVKISDGDRSPGEESSWMTPRTHFS